MNPSKPVAVVELVSHTSRCVNGENVVLRKREWLRSEDPGLVPPLVRVCHQLVEKSIDEKTGRAIISALRLACRISETRSHCCELGISRGQSRDLPRRSLGIPMGSVGILACKSFRSWDHVKKRLFSRKQSC